MFQFRMKKDRDLVLNRAHWTIKGAQILVKPWQEYLTLEEIDFLHCPLWIRLYGLPLAAINQNSVRRFADFFGEIEECNIRPHDRFGAWVKFKVSISLTKTIFPGFFLDRENRPPLWIQTKHENIGLFYYRCGRLGHVQMECCRRTDMLIMKEGFDAIPVYGEWLAISSEIQTCFTAGGRRRKTEKRYGIREKGPASGVTRIPASRWARCLEACRPAGSQPLGRRA